MVARVMVSGILLVIMVCILVFVVEFFIPLSVKADMNTLCRNTLLEMERAGGLSEGERLSLRSALEDKGLEAVSISGTPYAKQGEKLRLHVDAVYRYSRLASLFARSDTVQPMDYDKVAMSRKVVN